MRTAYADGRIYGVDVNEDFVISLRKQQIKIHDFVGQLLQLIQPEGNTWDMTLFSDLILTGGGREDKFLRMWDFNFNRKCVAEMEGHDDGIVSISTHGDYLASSDYSGGLQIRKISRALEGHRSGFLKLRNSSPEPDDWCQGVRLEHDFLACWSKPTPNCIDVSYLS